MLLCTFYPGFNFSFLVLSLVECRLVLMYKQAKRFKKFVSGIYQITLAKIRRGLACSVREREIKILVNFQTAVVHSALKMMFFVPQLLYILRS